MAFTGFTTGTLHTATQGTSTGVTLVIDKVLYYSSTGGPGKKCIIADRRSGVVIYRGTVASSYGLAPAAYQDGVIAHGIIVKSLPEGYVQVMLR